MRNLLFLIAIALLISLNTLADPPSPPGGGSTGNSGTQGPPVGAPIDSGVIVLLAMGAAYGGNKLVLARKKRRSGKASSTLLCIAFLLTSVTTFAQSSVGINNDGSTPDASAMLDVKSTSKGLLPPRVNLTGTTSASPVTSPATGLIVYNLATVSDVTPGYYFWDGSAWDRFSATGSTKMNIVSKSATGALLKTDEMVLASNDVTLTLPAITSTDNGLSITVKNVGSYLDLITIQGNGGATIDGLATSTTLTRWKSCTFVASGGNWLIKEQQSRSSSIIDVCANGSFTTIAEVVAFLNDHMSEPTVIRLGGGNHPISSTVTINLPYSLTFQGPSYGVATIVATTSGSPAFSCSSEAYFKSLNFNGSGASDDGIRLTGANEYYEVKDCNFTGFTRAVALTGASELWVFEVDFNDATTAGIEVAGGSTCKVSECDFINCAIGINLVSGTTPTFSAMNCTFYNSTGQTGINYVPATFAPFSTIDITNNAYNNVGTFIAGFDFTLTSGRDAKAFLDYNAGLESKSPNCWINVINNSSTTTVTTANTYYRANWTNTNSNTCKYTIGTTGPTNGNRFLYQPSNTRSVTIILTGNLSVNGSSRTVNYGFVKNGISTTRYGESTIYCASSNQPYQFSTVVHIENITASDYFDLYVTSSTNGDLVKIQDVNIFAYTP